MVLFSNYMKVLTPHNIRYIAEALFVFIFSGKKFFKATLRLMKIKKPKVLLPTVRINPVIDIVEIGTGCLSSCTFCQVKIAKGTLVSYPPDAIIKQITDSLGINKIIMFDHDDQHSSILKSKYPISKFLECFNTLVEYCKNNNVILLRTVGVVFSDEEK